MSRATRALDFIARQADYLAAAGWDVSTTSGDDWHSMTAIQGQRSITITADQNTRTGNWALGLGMLKIAGSATYFYETYDRISGMVSSEVTR